ncbi:MAG: hypothetical protein LBI28_12295, partial [Treponema sp.]|nr:hypothetical protein [Treponema sp.]
MRLRRFDLFGETPLRAQALPPAALAKARAPFSGVMIFMRLRRFDLFGGTPYGRFLCRVSRETIIAQKL